MLIRKVNAFTESKQGGNPAGVVFDSPPLTDSQMKHISKTLQVSETAFFFPSTQADYHVRFFSPTIEVALCGHATIASFYALAKIGATPPTDHPTHLSQETGAGILPIDIYFKKNKVEKVMMTQQPPTLKNLHWDTNEIATMLNIDSAEIDSSLPKQKVSTGLFTLPICLHTKKSLTNVKPDFHHIKQYCIKHDLGSFHIFTFETIEKNSLYHARNFPPAYGINEDPVTGTANGAVSSYLVRHNLITTNQGICEQGDIMGRPGRVHINIEQDKVQVGGKAIIVKEQHYDPN